MTRLALIGPTTLLGQEIRTLLDRRREIWSEMSLLSAREDEIGVLTEVRGEATVVEKLANDSLDNVDLALFCGPVADYRSVSGDLRATTSVLIASPDAGTEDGYPVVAGLNLELAEGHPRVLSPHPEAVLLCNLLAPLSKLGLEEVVATLIEPISMHERSALDGVLEETRNLLAFQPRTESSTFPAQVAFNLFPSGTDTSVLADLLRATLEQPELRVALRAVQGSVFHGVTASVFVRFSEDVDAESIRSALGEHPEIDFSPDPELLGPIDSPSRDEVLVGEIQAAADGFWIWAVMDNLTIGGAGNSFRIAERMLETGPAS